MVICLERGADLHMAQRMPTLLTVSCFSKIQFGFTFMVPAHPGSPGQRAVKRVFVCVCASVVCIFIEGTSVRNRFEGANSLLLRFGLVAEEESTWSGHPLG